MGFSLKSKKLKFLSQNSKHNRITQSKGKRFEEANNTFNISKYYVIPLYFEFSFMLYYKRLDAFCTDQHSSIQHFAEVSK